MHANCKLINRFVKKKKTNENKIYVIFIPNTLWNCVLFVYFSFLFVSFKSFTSLEYQRGYYDEIMEMCKKYKKQQ